jgi:hypothetical protein
MARTRLSAALERDQRDPVLRREWRFERVGWAALALILVAGSLGVFGGGVVAAASGRSTDGVAMLQYDRIIRRDAPSTLEVRLSEVPLAATVGDSVVVVSLTEDYFAATDVQRVMPEPMLVRASSGRVEYHLLRLDPSRPMVVRFSVRANAMGTYRAVVGVDGRVLSFRQLVLP